MEKKTKYALLSLTIILMLAIFLIATIQPQQTGLFAFKEKELTIGVITPLTGQLSNFGEGTKNSVKLAIDEINSKGGINGQKVNLIIEDSPCDTQSAVNAATKLIEIDKVNFIIGPLCSSELLAIAPIVEKSKTLILSPSATSPDITNAGDYVFRNTPSDDLRAEIFANYIYNEARVNELAIIYPIDNVAIDYVKFFEETFESLGGKIIGKESYQKNSVDFRTQLSKIKEAKAIFTPNWPVELANILKQSKELGIDANFFEGFEVMGDPQIKEIAKGLENGVTYIQPITASSTQAKEFKNKYLLSYSFEPPYYAAEAFDAVKLFEKALKNANGNTSLVKDELYKIQNFQGASGTISFDEHGDVKKPFEIGQVINDKLVTIEIK